MPDEPKISIDEVDRTIGKDSQISCDEYQKASSTKCSEKDLELNSFREEEEKEREKLSVNHILLGCIHNISYRI